MRILAWVAVFSLQLGMFVCGAGIDVCPAVDAPAQARLSPAQLSPAQLSPFHSDTGHQAAPIETCAAHAAHVFLGQAINNHGTYDLPLELVNIPTSLNFPEIAHFIDQPPKLLHS